MSRRVCKVVSIMGMVEVAIKYFMDEELIWGTDGEFMEFRIRVGMGAK